MPLRKITASLKGQGGRATKWPRVGISVSDPDPDPYGSVSFGRIRIRIRIRKPLIWIRVASKINQNHGINKSKLFVNVLFT